MIPKIIHQIWFGDKPSEEIEFLMSTFAYMHPDWEYHLWSEKEIMAEDNFPKLNNRKFALQSDWFRLYLLQRYGGIYVDSDFECVKSFDSLVENNTFFAGMPTNKHVSNALIGSIPNHPILNSMIEKIISTKYSGHYGPEFLTEAINNSELSVEVNQYEKKYFYPYYCGEKLPENYESETYAAHHWHASWLNSRTDLHEKFVKNVAEVKKRYEYKMEL